MMPRLEKIRQKSALVWGRLKRLPNSLLVSLHLRKNREMLSFVIDKMKEKSLKVVEKRASRTFRMLRKIAQGLFSRFETGLVFVTVSMVILWLLPLYEWVAFLGLNISTQDFKSFFLVLWQVQASMLGITFVVIMFLVGNLIAKIESTYEKFSGRIIHEFLSVSKIYIVLPFCLCSIAYIGMAILFQDTRQTYQNLILFLLNIASIFYLFYAAFNFFRPRSLEKLRLKHLKDEITKSIDAEINHRVSENILIGQDQKSLRYFPFGVPDKAFLTAVRSPSAKLRVISDINLSKILAYSQISPITLVRSIGSSLSRDNNVLCYVQTNTDPNVIQAIRDCFVLKEAGEETVLFEALNGVQEELREAIRTGNVTKLERVLDTYLSLLESFLQQTSAYGVRYDSKTARSELDFGWRQIFEIRRSIEQAVEYAFRQGDWETIRWAMYFPIKVANLAVRYEDHFLFQRFIHIFPFIYFLGSKVADSRIANFAIDRSWRYLAEMSLHIHFLMENVTEVERISDLKDYIVETLLTFNGLLKTALDNKDFESFKKFGFALDDVFKYFEPETQLLNVQVTLRDPSLTREEKSKLHLQLKIKQDLVEAKEKVEGIKKCIWFGLGAWATRLYRKQELPQNDFQTLFNDVSTRFDNLEKLSSTFGLLTSLSDVGFGWDFWMLKETREREVSKIDTQEWMQWFYCIQAIRLTPTSIGEGTPIASSRIVVDRFENLKTICNNILEEPEKWQSILNEKIKEKISNFLLLHQRAAEKQIENEKQWLIEQELSTQLCEGFTNRVVEAWKASASVRAIIEILGNCMDLKLDGECKKIGYFGINTLTDKAAFVEEWHVGYPMFGDTFGKSVANGENDLLLKEICSPLELHQKPKRDEICGSLHSAIMKLRQSQFKPDIIFIRGRDTLGYLRGSERFKPKSRDPSSKIEAVGCVGYFESIPIFLLRECPSDCCIVDIARLGVLNRCRLDSGSQPYLEISITQIDDKLAKSMIGKSPNLLKNEKGKDRPIEAAMLHLKQKVILKILEKTKFKVREENAGLRLEFAD